MENAKDELLFVPGWTKPWRHILAFDGLRLDRMKDLKETA